MTQPRSETVMALAKVERQLDALLDDVTRMRNYKGFAVDLRPIYQREVNRLNALIVTLGGRSREIKV